MRSAFAGCLVWGVGSGVVSGASAIARGKLFHSTDTEVLGDDEVVELDLALGILDLQEGTGVAHIDEALRQPKLDLSGELEQAGCSC